MNVVNLGVVRDVIVCVMLEKIYGTKETLADFLFLVALHTHADAK